MKRTVLASVVVGLLLAAAAPAVGQDIRDRVVFNGVNADGIIASGVVVDDYPADFMSVAYSTAVRCVDAGGGENTITTLTSISIPDADVDVPQLLKGVAASGTGSGTVAVTDRCAGTFTITEIEDVPVTLSGTRTSKLQNFGNTTFTGEGSGTLTVGDITVEVTLDFERRPLT